MAKGKKPKAGEDMAFALKEARQQFTNEPTVFYKVGDRVIHGNIKESHVTEVLDGGKILLLHQIVTEHNYGKPFDTERDMYVQWHNVTPYRVWKDEEQIKHERFLLQYYHTELRGLLGKVYHFGVDFDPNYQRGLVWEPRDKTDLIESIFHDVDIGKFVFAHRPYTDLKAPLYEIIDGKQRLTTIIEFYEGRFKWREKTYYELHPADQRHFECYGVNVAEMQEPSKRQILDCFVRMNTSGKPQDQKHLEQVRKLLEKEENK